MLLVKKILLFKRSPENEQTNGDPKPSEEKPGQQDNVALAKALKEMREKTVSKEEYERVVNENKKLVSEIINGDGGAGDGQSNPPEKADIKALREELYGPKGSDLNNLDFWAKTLALREAVIEQEGYDPFLPHGAKIKPNEQDVERANAVAKTVQKCIDEANGNSEVFTALLQAETANDSPSFLAHLKKIGALK